METNETYFDTLWRTTLGELEVEISKPNFITWFRDTSILGIEDRVLLIGVPNSFALEWLANKYRPQILRVLKKLLPDDNLQTIEFKIAAPGTVRASQPAADVVLPKAVTETAPAAIAHTTDATGAGGFALSPHYTFDSFIVGTHNRLAYAAGLAIASEPGRRHNPFVIYGGVGLGKTHLMQAIAQAILLKNPRTRVLYAPCERFANEFIQAIQTKRTETFKEKYRNVDVLLIDDIQFLSGKEGTQEEFFHTFNALHQSNRQIILTSDRMPQAIPELEDRLSSRFVWGMVTDIKSPDLETRAAILKQKCLDRGTELEADVIDLLARSFQSNIRELEGGLNQVLATCELENTQPTHAIVAQILKDRRPSRKAQVAINQVLSTISKHYHISSEEILGPRRNKEFVHPRQILMYLLRNELDYSYPKIGRELGKDHTTIMHGVEKIEKELAHNPVLQTEVTTVKELLYN